jgi:hypothetical protein
VNSAFKVEAIVVAAALGILLPAIGDAEANIINEGIALGVVGAAALAIAPFYLVGRYAYRKVRYASHTVKVFYGTNRQFDEPKFTYTN